MRLLAAPLLILLLLSGLPVSAAREGYVNSKINVITEPGESSSYVSFYKNGEKASLAGMARRWYSTACRNIFRFLRLR